MCACVGACVGQLARSRACGLLLNASATSCHRRHTHIIICVCAMCYVVCHAMQACMPAHTHTHRGIRGMRRPAVWIWLAVRHLRVPPPPPGGATADAAPAVHAHCIRIPMYASHMCVCERVCERHARTSCQRVLVTARAARRRRLTLVALMSDHTRATHQRGGHPWAPVKASGARATEPSRVGVVSSRMLHELRAHDTPTAATGQP